MLTIGKSVLTIYVHKIQDVRLKWFQLRILHRCLGTNVVLKQMGIAKDENCTFCNSNKDSIEHIFWDCNHVQNFWTELKKIIGEKCMHAVNMKLSRCLVLLGNDESIEIDDTLHYIILLAKQYIYHCKFANVHPHIVAFINKLKIRYKMEEYIAHINFELHKFKLRWLMYKTIIDT